MNLIPKIMKAKGLEVGSNGRVPAQQCKTLSSTLGITKKKQREKERKKS
jgi:hypothetical protein